MLPFNIVLIPIFSFILAQGLKIIIHAFKGSFKLKDFAAYGGMPSAHTAFTASMATMAGMVSGFNSVLFMIALVVTLLVIRDAVGLRMHLSVHSQVLNRMIKDANGVDQNKYPFLGERLGHTPAEVTVGAIIGIVFTALMQLWVG